MDKRDEDEMEDTPQSVLLNFRKKATWDNLVSDVLEWPTLYQGLS